MEMEAPFDGLLTHAHSSLILNFIAEGHLSAAAVFLQIHVPCLLPTQYNVERSKELCLNGFNTVCGVGGGGRDVQC